MTKLLTCHRIQIPKAEVDRLYVPKSEGVRGTVQLELSDKNTTTGLQRYLETVGDWMMICVKAHERSKKLY